MIANSSNACTPPRSIIHSVFNAPILKPKAVNESMAKTPHGQQHWHVIDLVGSALKGVPIAHRRNRRLLSLLANEVLKSTFQAGLDPRDSSNDRIAHPGRGEVLMRGRIQHSIPRSRDSSHSTSQPLAWTRLWARCPGSQRHHNRPACLHAATCPILRSLGLWARHQSRSPGSPSPAACPLRCSGSRPLLGQSARSYLKQHEASRPSRHIRIHIFQATRWDLEVQALRIHGHFMHRSKERRLIPSLFAPVATHEVVPVHLSPHAQP